MQLVVEDLPSGLLIENCLINVDFLNNNRKYLLEDNLLSITEIISSNQQDGKGTFHIVNNYILGF